MCKPSQNAMRKKEAGLTAMLRSFASHDVSRKKLCHARTVVPDFFIGGPNSLCGQSRERRGVGAVCALVRISLN